MNLSILHIKIDTWEKGAADLFHLIAYFLDIHEALC